MGTGLPGLLWRWLLLGGPLAAHRFQTRKMAGLAAAALGNRNKARVCA